MILEKGPQIELSHLRQEHLQAVRAENGIRTAGTPGEGQVLAFNKGGETTVGISNAELHEKGLTQVRNEMDEIFVKKVLSETLTVDQGNVSAVARKLKLDRANLLRMLKRFDITPELFRQKKAS